MERTKTTDLDILNAIKDIKESFVKLPNYEIIKAIKLGSLAQYGVTYKLTIQVICFWIRSYLKEKNNKFY